MSRTNIIGLIILLLASGIFAFAVINFNTLFPKKTSPSLSTSSKTLPPQEGLISKKSLLPPIKIKDPIVLNAQVHYVFLGKIVQLTNTDKGKKLVADFSTKQGIPEFLITSQTKIFFLDTLASEPKETTSVSLRVGQSVHIVAEYALRTRGWTITQVFILPLTQRVSPPPVTTTP